VVDGCMGVAVNVVIGKPFFKEGRKEEKDLLADVHFVSHPPISSICFNDSLCWS